MNKTFLPSRKVTTIFIAISYAISLNDHAIGAQDAQASAQNHQHETVEPGISLLAGQLGGAGNLDGASDVARFAAPRGITRDGAGNLYVVDMGGRTIRKISANGTVTTLAGNANQDGAVDGSGVQARFSELHGIAVDKSGNIYATDDTTIRKITPAGIVTTLAGNPDTKGNVDGVGAEARFDKLLTIAVDDSGNVFVTSWGNANLRKITAAGIVSSIPIATTGTNSYERFAVASDPMGNIYVADDDQGTISKLEGNTFKLVAGPFTIPSKTPGARFLAFGSSPLAVDKNGNFYVSDSSNIIKIAQYGSMQTLAVTQDLERGRKTHGAASQVYFDRPEGLVTDDEGNIYVTENTSTTIKKLTPAGVVTTFAGSEFDATAADGHGADAGFSLPHGITADASGNLYVVETNSGDRGSIRKIDARGNVTTFANTEWLSASTSEGGESVMRGEDRNLAVDKKGNIYVADTVRNAIRKITPQGHASILAGDVTPTNAFVQIWQKPVFNEPTNLAVDEQGNVYVTGGVDCTVSKINAKGLVTTLAGIPDKCQNAGDGYRVPLNIPDRITVDGAGNVYVSERAADDGSIPIRKIAPDGNVTTYAVIADDGMAKNERYHYHTMTSLTADRDGTLYYVDSPGNTIKMLDTKGKISIVAGTVGMNGVMLGPLPGSLSIPTSLAIDKDGNLDITVHNAILKIRLK